MCKPGVNLKGIVIGVIAGLICWIVICGCVAIVSAQPFNSPLPTRPPIPTRTPTPSTDNHHYSPLPTPTVYSMPTITPLPKFAEVEAPRRVVKRIGGFVK